uniref:Uncharacterized protein n=1 Tax=Trichobilharzia regenti TaxID=157069 RepID=A0AA85JDR6_TRIRE|nr:unnamed protein product [Trichobilharzia regenti]
MFLSFLGGVAKVLSLSRFLRETTLRHSLASSSLIVMGFICLLLTGVDEACSASPWATGAAGFRPLVRLFFTAVFPLLSLEGLSSIVGEAWVSGMWWVFFCAVGHSLIGKVASGTCAVLSMTLVTSSLSEQ